MMKIEVQETLKFYRYLTHHQSAVGKRHLLIPTGNQILTPDFEHVYEKVVKEK